MSKLSRRAFGRLLMGAGVSGLALAVDSKSAFAVTVTCTNCASLTQQLIDYGIRVKQYSTQLLQYANEVKQYILAVQNTVRLPFQVLDAVNGLYFRVSSIARRATAVLTSDAGIMSRIGMASSLIDSAGRFPSGAVRNAEWWTNRVQERWEDNRELLGMNEEAQLIMQDASSIAAQAGVDANGHLEAAQAQSAQLAVTSQQLSAIHAQMQRDFMYQVEKDMENQLEQAEYRKFMEGLTRVRQGAWSR